MISCHTGEFHVVWVSCCAFLGSHSMKWSIVGLSQEANNMSASFADGPEVATVSGRLAEYCKAG